ncbi:AAA family ATPase [bacterium]|nr:AAA family ATPase [bacterium]
MVSVQEYFIDCVDKAGFERISYSQLAEKSVKKDGKIKLYFIPLKNNNLKLCLCNVNIPEYKHLSGVEVIPKQETYPKKYSQRVYFKGCNLNEVKDFLDNILEQLGIVSSTGLLEETIIKYTEFKKSSEYREQYKYDYVLENKGIFDDLDKFEEKITNLKRQNFEPYFIGQCSGLRHLTNNYMGELKKACCVLFSSDDLENRLRTFKNILNEKLINDDMWRNNKILVDVQTASYFLFTNNYEKNLLFTQMKPFNKFAKMFGLSDLEKYESDEERYIKWQEYCKNTLLPKMDEVLNKKHTLLDAQDLIWFVWNNRKDKTTKEEEQNEDKEPMEELNIPKNQILYGPPGTGKTYNTVIKAMSIIDNKEYSDVSREENKKLKNRFDKLKQSGQIEFVTFHQSYSYEEFVEGIKPVLENKDLTYKLEDGIFKQICEHAKPVITTTSRLESIDFSNTKVFKMSLGNTLEKEEDIYNYCIENDVVSLGWKDVDFSDCKTSQDFKNLDDTWGATALERFVSWIDKGDIIIISNGNKHFRAIAQVKGDYFYDKNTPISHTHFRKVEWLYKGEDIHHTKINNKIFSQQSIYAYFNPRKRGQQDYNPDLNTVELNKIITGEVNKETTKPHVLIIDEINRGDVSKIFGELITLIEEDKRLGAEYAMTTTLPYSKESFGVPNNLFIIGTMNTADRSIALLDTALRRRFDFEEMMPRPELLKNREVGGINLQTLLTRINERIEKEYDRDHQIGHSYLMGVNNEKELERAYKNRILPLLNEYFYNDTESVAKILNCKVEELKDNFLKVLKNAQSNDNNK